MVVRLTMVVAALVSLVGAADMVFTMEDGSEYTLHDDGTWECKGAGCGKAAEDFVVNLSDGRDVAIGLDKQWHIKGKEELVGTGDILVNEAHATSDGTAPNVDQAVSRATESAMNKVAQKIKDGAKKRKMTLPVIRACMQRLRYMPEIKQSHGASGWSATATITLNRSDILKIVECAQDAELVPQSK